jgi:hypothetical protein
MNYHNCRNCGSLGPAMERCWDDGSHATTCAQCSYGELWHVCQRTLIPTTQLVTYAEGIVWAQCPVCHALYYVGRAIESSSQATQQEKSFGAFLAEVSWSA